LRIAYNFNYTQYARPDPKFIYVILRGWELDKIHRFSNTMGAMGCRSLGGIESAVSERGKWVYGQWTVPLAGSPLCFDR